MEEIARVYAEALFEVAQDKDKLDEIHDQLGEVADAIAENRDLQVFLFSPYFSSAEKRAAQQLEASGKRLHVVAPEGPVRRLLEITGTASRFSLHATRDEAFASA